MSSSGKQAETRIRLEITQWRRAFDCRDGPSLSRSHDGDARAILPPRSLASGDRRSEASSHRGRRNRLRRRHRGSYARDVRALWAPHRSRWTMRSWRCRSISAGGRTTAARFPARCTITGFGRSPTTRMPRVHVRVLRGADRHHIVEAAFKALGLALHDALIDSGTRVQHQGKRSMVTRRRSCLSRREGRPRRERRPVRVAARRRRPRGSRRSATRPMARTRSCISTSRQAPKNARHSSTSRDERPSVCSFPSPLAAGFARRTMSRAHCAPEPTRSV